MSAASWIRAHPEMAEKIGAVQATRGIAAALPVIAAFIGAVCITPAEAATFNVDSSLDAADADPGNGICSTSAGVCTLRAAVQEANALVGKDTVNVPAGTYPVTSKIEIRDSVDVLGASAFTTIVSGGSTRPIFQVSPSGAGPGPTVNIHRLTLRDGSVEFGGGAALRNEEGATTTLWDSIVRDNSSEIFGGGISNVGKLQIIRSEIRNNRLPAGGGGVTSSGGGIFNVGELDIVCSAVTENFATRGGGIFNGGTGVVKIKNSTISSNRALGGGGGIRNVGGRLLFIEHLTLNRANESSAGAGSEPNRTGGGIQTFSPATVTIGGTILAGNSDNRSRFQADFSPDCSSNSAGAFSTMRANVFGVVNNQCRLSDAIPGTNASVDLRGTDTAPLDPMLDQLAGAVAVTRTHALRVGSPAIDGNTTTTSSEFFACESVDQRGSPRPTDGDGNGQVGCDIGAYERQVTPSAVNPAVCDRLQLGLPSPEPPTICGSSHRGRIRDFFHLSDDLVAPSFDQNNHVLTGRCPFLALWMQQGAANRSKPRHKAKVKNPRILRRMRRDPALAAHRRKGG